MRGLPLHRLRLLTRMEVAPVAVANEDEGVEVAPMAVAKDEVAPEASHELGREG